MKGCSEGSFKAQSRENPRHRGTGREGRKEQAGPGRDVQGKGASR